MKMGHAVAEGLHIHGLGTKRIVDDSGHLGHLFEVEGTHAAVELKDVRDTFLGDEERSTAKVLIGCQSYIAGLEASSEPRIGTFSVG